MIYIVAVSDNLRARKFTRNFFVRVIISVPKSYQKK